MVGIMVNVAYATIRAPARSSRKLFKDRKRTV